MSRSLLRAWLVRVLVALAACGCGPIQLQPVPQPISCHCPAMTTLFRGELERTANGTSVKHELDLVMERTPEELTVLLVDAKTERALCSVVTDLHGVWQTRQRCSDPMNPASTNTLTLVRGTLTVHENVAELVFDAVLESAAASQAVKGRFVGKSVSVPAG